MNDEYFEKTKLLNLCRDINKGLFSEDAKEDIKELLILYNKCGNRTDKENAKNISLRNKSDKKQLLKIIYICFVNMWELDLNSAERLVFAEEIIKEGGFLYCSEKYGTRSITMELLRLAKNALSDTFDDSKEEEKRGELLTLAKKFSPLKIILFNKVS